eukprot:254506_1
MFRNKTNHVKQELDRKRKMAHPVIDCLPSSMVPSPPKGTKMQAKIGDLFQVQTANVINTTHSNPTTKTNNPSDVPTVHTTDTNQRIHHSYGYFNPVPPSKL